MSRLFHLLLCLAPLTLSGEPSSGTPRVAYFTDPEGNFDKLIEFLAGNESFERGSDGKYHLKAGAQFVFGGDAVDRDSGSIRIVRELLRLKQEGGERVTFIVGNRDVNKVRLVTQIAEGGVGADPAAKAKQLQEGFTKMNAARAFEHRRQELALLQGIEPATITDAAVAEHYLNDFGPQGEFTRFLEQGQVARRIGNTLFVHGGLSAESLGHVPGAPRVENVDAWIEQLNGWYRKEIGQWKSGARAAELAAYGGPAPGMKINPESVIYSKTADASNNPFLPDPAVIEKLVAAGIRRVVIGHTPLGQVPVVLRYGDNFEVVWGDNSYAPKGAGAPQITFEGNNLETTAIGADRVSFRIKLGEKTPIGKRLSDGSLVIAPTGDDFLTFKIGEKYAVKYETLTATEVQNRTPTDPLAPGSRPVCHGLGELAGPTKPD